MYLIFKVILERRSSTEAIRNNFLFERVVYFENKFKTSEKLFKQILKFYLKYFSKV